MDREGNEYRLQPRSVVINDEDGDILRCFRKHGRWENQLFYICRLCGLTERRKKRSGDGDMTTYTKMRDHVQVCRRE